LSFFIFNNCSLPFDSRDAAIAAIGDFLRMCLKANVLGFKTIRVVQDLDPKWYRVQLAPGYFFQDWQGTPGVDRDLWRAFLSISTKTPLVDFSEGQSELALIDVQESTLDHACSALVAAVWLQVPVSSFPSRPPWNHSPIAVKVRRLNDGNLNETDEGVVNWYSLAVLQSLEPELIRKRAESIRQGNQLWLLRRELFPCLEFCGQTPAQIQTDLTHSTLVHQVTEALQFLNLFAERWRDGVVPHFSIELLRSIGLPHAVSRESQSVHDDPDLRHHREFFLNSGHRILFEHHVKLALGWRLHFYAEESTRTIHVGYIGSHLPTKKYR